jgi:histidinol-phosphate aminotransferase
VTARTAPRPIPPHLVGLERYEPGLAIEHVEAAPGVRRIVKLASNENPFGPSPRALAAIAEALPRLHRYPDGPALALREALAGRLGVAPEQVAVGNGSTDLIDLLARAFLGPEDNAVISERAFARFAQVVRARNGHARLVPMRDDRHDLEAMAAAVDRRTRLVYVANPNNPTGTWNRRGEIDALVEALPPQALLVLDEAYFEFARGEDGYPDGLDYVRGGAPVVVVRTFSKAHGLAGLRVGYGIAAPDLIAAVDTVREPFNSNSLAQAGALAALFDDDHVERAVGLNRTERPRVEAELRRRGLASLPSLANFLCVDTGRDGLEIFRRLLRRGVIVRPLRAYGMPAWLRVSIATAEDNDFFLQALDAVLEDLPPA